MKHVILNRRVALRHEFAGFERLFLAICRIFSASVVPRSINKIVFISQNEISKRQMQIRKHIYLAFRWPCRAELARHVENEYKNIEDTLHLGGS